MMDQTASVHPVVFSLAATGQSSPGLLGAWIAAPAPNPAGVSFAIEAQMVGQDAPPEGVVWCCDLPGDDRQARLALSVAETRLHAVEAALNASTEQVDSLIQHKGAASFALSAFEPAALPASFALEGGSATANHDNLDADESIRLQQVARETLGLLAYSTRAAAAPGTSFSVEAGWDAASFGLIDDISSRWNEAVRQYQDFMSRVSQAVGYLAWVETRVDGQLQVRTRVNWDGDFETGWSILPDPHRASQHTHSLRLALASRIMLLRVFTVIGTTAVKLTTLSAVPGGVILALPTALNFINQVKLELDHYQQQIKAGSG